MKIKYFWFVTWPHSWSVIWLCGWGSLILSHHPAKVRVHRSREGGDITFLICHVNVSRDFVGGPLIVSLVNVEIQRFLLVTRPQYWSVTWICGWVLLILSHYPAKFRVHRPYETGNSGVCNITFNSNSNSNSNSSAEVQCRGLQMVICFALKNLSLVSFRELQLTQI